MPKCQEWQGANSSPRQSDDRYPSTMLRERGPFCRLPIRSSVTLEGSDLEMLRGENSISLRLRRLPFRCAT